MYFHIRSVGLAGWRVVALPFRLLMSLGDNGHRPTLTPFFRDDPIYSAPLDPFPIAVVLYMCDVTSGLCQYLQAKESAHCQN